MEVKRAEERAGNGTKRLTMVEAAHRIPMAQSLQQRDFGILGEWEEK
jgi:hypothetical protein